MRSLWTDLRTAARALRSTPGLCAAAVLALSLGVASALTLYTAFRAIADDLPPIPHPERVAHLYLADETAPMGWRVPRGSDRAALVDPIADRTVASVVRDVGADVVIDGCAREDSGVVAEQVEPTFFDVVAVPPQIGRTWTAADLGDRAPAIISADLWRRACGADPAVVGRTAWVDRRAYTVIGVMPDVFRFLGFGVGVWVPLEKALRPDESLTIYARLTGAATWQSVNDRLAATAGRDRGLAVALTDPRIRRNRIAFVGLLGPALLVLLVACANAAALLVGRTLQRRRELGIRLSVGAPPWRLAREAFAETAVVALAAGLAALPLAAAGTAGLRHLFGLVSPPIAKTITMDTGALTFGLACVGVTVLLTGLLPAFRAASSNVTSLLASTPPPVIVRRGHYTGTDLLLVLQVGLAVVLLVVSAMFLRLVGLIASAPPGPADRTFTAELHTRDRSMPDAASLQQLAERLGAVPGVVRVTVANDRPVLSSRTPVEALDAPAQRLPCTARSIGVTAAYFETFPVTLRAGSLFTGWEPPEAPRVAVVSEGLARRCWGRADVIGERLRIRGGDRATWLVTGVVSDADPEDQVELTVGELYVPYAQQASGAPILLVETRAAAGMAARLDDASRSEAFRPPRWRTLAVVADEMSQQIRTVPRILQGLAAIALLLATLGVYASIAQSVARDRRNLAIRLTLGAGPARLVAAGVSRQAILSAVGIFGGVLTTVTATHFMFAELLQTVAPDRGLWIGVLGPLAACAVLAWLGPMVRIVRLDPIAALRRADE